jgi:hypothetical protein
VSARPTVESTRAKYVREHYRLERTPDGWRAVSEHGGINSQTGEPWSSYTEITGPDRDKVVREARCRWGHFNFEDEARAFNAVFTTVSDPRR